MRLHQVFPLLQRIFRNLSSRNTQAIFRIMSAGTVQARQRVGGRGGQGGGGRAMERESRSKEFPNRAKARTQNPRPGAGQQQAHAVCRHRLHFGGRIPSQLELPSDPPHVGARQQGHVRFDRRVDARYSLETVPVLDLFSQHLCQQRAQRTYQKRVSFELFADAGAKERGPELGPSLISIDFPSPLFAALIRFVYHV